jgi:streptogramin lyase
MVVLAFQNIINKTKTVLHFQPQPGDTSNLESGTITAITMDGHGTTWLGTFGNGLFRFDEAKGEFANYQYDQGLQSNYINVIIPDDKNNLWISTADGMNFLKAGERNLNALEINFVFLSNSVTINGIKGLDGKLYFFCYDQFVAIDPVKFEPDLTFPPVVISHFRILNNEVPFSVQHTSINLSHRENFFSFEYSALNTQPGHPVHFCVPTCRI